MTPEEIEAFRKKYGRDPPAAKKGGALGRLGGKERKYFDSADHALSRSGVNTKTGKVIATTAILPKKTSRPSGMTEQSSEGGEGAEE
eukprot:m.351995 g.351995  ORF g.351995 m.351995 type:complete len:87 (-) comp16419_c0_seq1:449-709(-)